MMNRAGSILGETDMNTVVVRNHQGVGVFAPGIDKLCHVRQKVFHLRT